MLKATVTSKGQITLPSAVRKTLEIRPGDRIVFEVQDQTFTARVLRSRNIDDIFAALPGVKVFAGAAAEREAFHEGLAGADQSEET